MLTRHIPRCFKGLLLATLFGFALVLVGCDADQEINPLNQALSHSDLSGFKKAMEPRAFVFPQDHASHPGYKNEWWYFTGNLESDQGRHFGYQLTFFRIALTPGTSIRKSAWATHHIWMTHAAITDIAAEQHLHDERFSREAAGLAGVTSLPFKVWLDDWQLHSRDGTFPWQLDVKSDDFVFSLKVEPEKAIVLQGEQGLSQKSPEPGNASYYYSITRLKTTGNLSIQGKDHQVSGLSWLDREWGTSLLAEDQQGWDWFSLQFDSGEDMMFYQLRNKDGSQHASSLGSWVDVNSKQSSIAAEDVELVPQDWWRAPDGSRFPIRWQVNLKSQEKVWIVEAAIPDQLMDVTIQYWEGAVLIFDASGKKQLGRGYLEMTGY